MERSKLNYLVDMVIFLAFILITITGILKWPGLATKIGLILPINFYKIHDWAGVILVLGIVIHLVLHWKIFWNMTKNFFR